MYSYTKIIAAVENAGPPRSTIDYDELVSAAQRPALTPLLAELKADAERTDPLPELPYRLFRRYVHDGDRSDYETRYFERRRRLNSAAIVAIVDPSNDNLMRLSDIVWLICDEYSWAVPAHHRFNTTLDQGAERCIDLFGAETAHTLAEIVTLLGDRLETPVVERIKHNVHHRVLSAFLDDPRSRWWETSTNNWAAVCGGAIGMSALCLEEDPLRLAALIDRVQRTMSCFLTGFTSDGGCSEGMDYWVYGFGYFTYYAEALRQRTGLDLLAGTDKIAAFPAAIDFGNASCVSFSDGSAHVVPPTGLMSRLKSRLQVPLPQLTRMSTFSDDHCYRWAHLTRTLLWANDSYLGRPVELGSAWLPDLAWAIDRGAQQDMPVAFAAKGGHNDEEHNQLDLGSFILAADGQQLLSDLGAGNYDRNYFGPHRYQALHTSASGHSVPQIAGVEQLPGREYSVKVDKYDCQPDQLQLELDMSGAYGGLKFHRSFTWNRWDRLTLTDEFEVPGVQLVERFISRVPPEVESRGRIRWRGQVGTVVLEYDGDWQAEFDRISTLDHHANPDTVYRVRLLGLTRSSCEFRFVVTPS